MTAPGGWRVRPGSPAEQFGRLMVAGLVVLFLPALPFGTYLAYPFVILTTWFHEMGHGLAALAAGQDFRQLQIFANGSGVAQSAVAADAGAWVGVVIAAGGPLGPSVVGAVLILASARERLWRPALWLMAGAIMLSVVLYVRSATGLIVLPLVAGLLALVAARGKPAMARFALQFVGLLGAFSVVRDFDYLLTREAAVGGAVMLSDTGQMAAITGLPHWLWAGAIVAASAALVGGALRYALKERRPKPPANVLQFKAGKRR